MMGTVFSLAFLAGFLGGFGHCIGMCGPIAAAYAFPAGRAKSAGLRIRPHLLFGAGRVTTYALIGSVMGLTGAFVNTAGRLADLQNVVALLAGPLMIAAGLGITGILGGSIPAGLPTEALVKVARSIVAVESPWKYYPLGLLLGFMPCGLSYTVLLGAAGSGGLLEGAAVMLCFGAGTLPAMLLFGSLITLIGSRVRQRLYRVGGAVVVLMGVWFLARGIGIYVSL